MNISIDTAVEPSGLCGLVVRTFVTRYGIRLRGLWGSQVRILSEANVSHIFRNRNFQVNSQISSILSIHKYIDLACSYSLNVILK